MLPLQLALLLTLLIILIGVLMLLVSVYFQPRPLLRIIHRITSNSVIFHFDHSDAALPRFVALSLDDAPSPYTKEILEILKKHDVRATFFVIGDHAKRFPQWLERIRAAGHEFGNHTMLDRPSWKLDDDALEYELVEVDKLIFPHDIVDDMVGVDDSGRIGATTRLAVGHARHRTKSTSGNVSGGTSQIERKPLATIEEPVRDTQTQTPKWFRPGHGITHARMLNLLQTSPHLRNYKLALASIYPHDPSMPFPVFNSEYIRLRAHRGGIICLHDGREWTPKCLDLTLTKLKQDGWTVGTIGEGWRLQSIGMSGVRVKEEVQQTIERDMLIELKTN